MGCGSGDVGSVFPIPVKDPSPRAHRFLFCCEWEKACPHRDQLEGIPISTAGVLPSAVLFSSEETDLFHPTEGASSLLLCVRVSVYSVPLTARAPNKCHPMPHTDTPLQLPRTPAAAHVLQTSLLPARRPLISIRKCFERFNRPKLCLKQETDGVSVVSAHPS